MRHDRSKHTVLIVDDDMEICEALEMAVSMEGYSVRIAPDHQEALETIAVEEPAIIFLDYYGVGDDTRTFVEAVRARGVSAPIVLMTGAKDPREKVRQVGLKSYLAKPFDLDDILKVLRKHRVERVAPPSERVPISLFA